MKIRGYRIEPGEVEAVLLEHSDVKEAFVVAEIVSGGEKRLLGYAVRKNRWQWRGISRISKKQAT